MTPLRVVLVLIEPPLPFGNAAARWFYVLFRGLVERGHRVTAFAACSKPQEIARAEQLFPRPSYDLRCYLFPCRSGWRSKLETLRRPYSYMFSSEFRHDLDAELRQGFDVLHLEPHWCGWLGLRHADRALLNVLSLFSIDLAEVGETTWKARLYRHLMFAAEKKIVGAFPHVRTLSHRLSERVRQINPTVRDTIVPLGLDTSLYRFIPNERRMTEPVVSVIGSMQWYPTRSAAVRLLTRLWPAIKRQVPKTRLQIVGWDARRALGEYQGWPDVTIEENVPDTRPYFESTGALLYAPSRGSGMKVKVLEALAFGVPVVTTGEGVEGIPAQDGVHAGISEDDTGLIERTVRLLQDKAAQDRQRAAGRALLEAHCDPGPTLDGIEAIYEKMCASDTATHPREAMCV
jgi:glycosyltransferase involved in cell wall biosynthesis